MPPRPAAALVFAFSVASFAAPAPAWQPAQGRELVGKPAPEFAGLAWVHGGPLTLAGLRGHPVLIRFWTSRCVLCERTAPGLRAVAERFGPRGLVVVGIHHPKSDAARDPAVVEATSRALGLDFPVALDDGWQTVRAYGVGTVFTRFTSVSVLVGPDGIVRWVHDGGELHPGGGAGHERCNQAFASLEAAIQETLPR